MNGHTPGEKLWTDTFDKALQACRKHVKALKDDDDFPYVINDDALDDMVIRAVYWGKRDNKKKLIDPKALKPYISPKLVQRFVDGERVMVTQCYNEYGKDIDYKDPQYSLYYILRSSLVFYCFNDYASTYCGHRFRNEMHKLRIPNSVNIYQSLLKSA